MKMFHNVVNSILCCAKEARASIRSSCILNEWEFFLKSYEKLQLCPRSVKLIKKKQNKAKQNKKNSAL